jgi:hypothetical protein
MEQYSEFLGVGAFFAIVLSAMSVIRFREGREVVPNEAFCWLLLFGAALEAALAIVPIAYRTLLQLRWQDMGMVADTYAGIKLVVFFDKLYPVVYHRN